MVRPNVEWGLSSGTTYGFWTPIQHSWRQLLDNILNQAKSVTTPAFGIFTQDEYKDFSEAKPYMTDVEMRKIAQSIHTPELVYRVAEAVWRVRSARLN